MRDATVGERLFRATPRLIMALVVVPVLGWLLWEGGLRRLVDVVALGIFIYVALVTLISDHAVGRASRHLLTRSLKRPVVAGEETSLNTWMRVDADQIAAAGHELEQVALEVEGAPFEPTDSRR